MQARSSSEVPDRIGRYALDRHLQLPSGRAYRWSVDDEDWEEESMDEGQTAAAQQRSNGSTTSTTSSSSSSAPADRPQAPSRPQEPGTRSRVRWHALDMSGAPRCNADLVMCPASSRQSL